MPIQNSILCTELRIVQIAGHRNCVWLILQVPKWSCLFKLFIISEKNLINTSAVVIHFHYPSNYFTASSKTKIHNMYFFLLLLDCFFFPSKKKPICIPAFHTDFKCCDLYYLSLKIEIINLLATATKIWVSVTLTFLVSLSCNHLGTKRPLSNLSPWQC